MGLQCGQLPAPYLHDQKDDRVRRPLVGVLQAPERSGIPFAGSGAGRLQARRRNSAAAAVQRSRLAPTTTNFTTRAQGCVPACANHGAAAVRSSLSDPSGTPTTTATAPLARSPLQWFK